MANISIGKAPKSTAVLPFYATGAVMFLVLCVLLFLSPSAFTGHHFTLHLLAIVHMAALGWGTMIIFGAAHQLLPVICERDLFSEKLAAFVWYSLTLGMLLITVNFWLFKVGLLLISGGVLVFFSALAFLYNSVETARLGDSFSIYKLFIVSSAVWLVATTLMGILLAVNLAFPYFEKSHLEILKLHAHAGLAGWFLQLITGVSTKLIPMFLLGKSQKEYLLKWSFHLQNLGLILFLCDGYHFGITGRIFVYFLFVFAGIILWFAYLYDAYKNRLRKKVEILMKHALVSLVSLAASLFLIPIIYLSSGERWTMLYGTFLFLGWITSLILGKSFKTLPFIIWNSRYKDFSGKVKVPLPKYLYSEKLTVWQFWLFLASLLVFAAGIVFQNLLILRLGALGWVAVAVLYNINVFKIIFHKNTLS